MVGYAQKRWVLGLDPTNYGGRFWQIGRENTYKTDHKGGRFSELQN